MFQIFCQHGIQKTYKLTFEECDIILVIYSKDPGVSRIVASPKKLIESMNNFHTSLDEITTGHVNYENLIFLQVVAKDSVRVKSYVDDAKGKFLKKIVLYHLKNR